MNEIIQFSSSIQNILQTLEKIMKKMKLYYFLVCLINAEMFCFRTNIVMVSRNKQK